MAQNEERTGVFTKGTGSAMGIDWEAYLPLIEDPTIPEAQKRELIETLWSITLAFVDLGFGLHPTQQSCGQDGEALAPAIEAVLDLESHTNRSAERPSGQFGAVAGKGAEDDQ